MEKQFRILIIPLIIFVSFFLLAGFFNRYASDDFEFLSKYRQYGFSGSVAYFYQHWNTRWLAIGFMNVVFTVTNALGSLFWYHIFSLLLLWSSFYRLIKGIITASKMHLLILSGFGACSFFYSCYSIPDVFFWVNTSTMYLFGTIAFVFAFGEIIRSTGSFSGYLLLVCSGFFLGGAYEPLVFTVMVAGAVYLFYMFYKNGGKVVQQPSVLKTIVLISVLMISFAVSYAGEGHTIRSSFLPQTTVGYKSWVWVKAMIKMTFFYLPSKLLLAVPLSLPWFVFAASHPFHKLNRRSVFLAAVTLMVLISLSLAPLAFVMSEMGPERAWTQISVFITLFSALLAAWLGTCYGSMLKPVNRLSAAVVLVCVFLLGTGLWNCLPAAEYSKAVDSRMEQLTALRIKNTTGVVSLKPLPAAGWLHSAEISEYRDHFTNMHLKNYLQLDFDIKKESGLEKP